jgi:hypothetical protein
MIASRSAFYEIMARCTLNVSLASDAEKSIAAIPKCLAAHGASQIHADYDEAGRATAISFRNVIDGNPIEFLALESEPVDPRLQGA